MDTLPPPVRVTQSSSSGGNKEDNEPLFEAKINNPFSKFFSWIKDFLKRNQNITIKIPIIGVLVTLSSFGLGSGLGYNLGFNAALAKLFPNSSPVFHRAISLEGTIQKSASNGYYLNSENNLWTLKPKPPITSTTLSSLTDQQVKVLGNLTKEANVVEVSEIIPVNSAASQVFNPEAQTRRGVPLEPVVSQIYLNSPNPSDNLQSSILPDLYSGLKWETNQKKLLIFTSGKRKIEQEGIYLESAQISAFPQDFINYYLENLKAQEFKETLNSINPEGITITYAKDNLFLTFGIKNIYKGSGNKKQLIGYKAYLEHN